MFGWLKRKAVNYEMNKIIGLLIRHGLTVAGGGALVAGSDVEQLSGAIGVIISVIWSILEKKNKVAN